MVWSMVVSGALCFGFSVAILFSIGDITKAIESPTTFPIIEIFYNATNSYRATNAMTAALILSMIFLALGLLASASRFAWAFARDNGLPFSTYFSHVSWHQGYEAMKKMLILTRLIANTGYQLEQCCA